MDDGLGWMHFLTEEQRKMVAACRVYGQSEEGQREEQDLVGQLMLVTYELIKFLDQIDPPEEEAK